MLIRRLSKQTNTTLTCIKFNRRAIHQLKTATTANDTKTTISNKTECLDELNRTSIYLTNSFASSSFMANKSYWVYQLKSQLATQMNQERKKIWSDELASLNQTINFISQKLSEFDIKEKSIIFRIVAIANNISPNKNSVKLLQNLECDLYDHIEKFDLIDWNNFDDGLNLFRTSRLHFINKTLSHSLELISKIVASNQVSNELFNSNPLVNQINTQWLENYNYKNDLLFSLHILHKIKPFLSNKTYFNKALLANEYINEQLKDESASSLLDKLVLHSYFSHFGYDKQFDRIATETFYDKLIETNLIKNLENINNSSMEKYFIRNVLIKRIESKQFSNKIPFESSLGVVEHYINKMKETTNIYDYNNYTSCVSEIFYSYMTQTKKNNDFRFFNKKFQKVLNRIIYSIENKNSEKIDSPFMITSPMRQSDNVDLFKQECRKIFQQEIKKFKKSDLDLPLIKRLIDLKRFNEPFYWLSNKTVLNLLDNIETNIDAYYSNDSDSLFEVLERITMSYREIEIPKPILKYLKFKLIQGHIFKKTTKIAILKIILRNVDLMKKEFKSIYPIVNELLDNNCSLEIAVDLFKSLNKNLEFFVNVYEKETNDLVNKIVRITIDSLTHIDRRFMNNSEQLAEDLIKGLYESKDMLKHLNYEISLDDLKSKKTQMIDDINKLTVEHPNEDIDSELKRFENFFFFYSLKLRCISDLIVISNKYNKENLSEIMQSCIQILTIFDKAIFGFKKYDAKNRTENLFKKKGFIVDLLTCYGLFNYYDIKHILNGNDMEANTLRENLAQLDEINIRNYHILQKYFNLNVFKLAKYSFSMLNLKITNSEALADLFQNNLSIQNICQKIHLNRENDILFCSKLLYLINTIAKCKNSSLPWLFENYQMKLPNKNQEKIYTDLTEMFGKDYVKRYPMYEFNLTADFELTTNENGEMVKINETENVKLRIPIFILNNNMTYKNLAEPITPIENYIECLKTFYPVVLIKQFELESKTFQERQDYLFSKMQSSVINYINKTKANSQQQ